MESNSRLSTAVTRTANPENIRTLERAITTIRFQPWELSDVRNGFEAVAADLPDGTGQSGLVKELGLIYVMNFDGETYVLDVPDVSSEGRTRRGTRGRTRSCSKDRATTISDTTQTARRIP
jgi:hypothetical protein